MKKGNDRKIGMRYNGDMDSFDGSLEVDFVLEAVNKLIRNHGIELTRRYGFIPIRDAIIRVPALSN